MNLAGEAPGVASHMRLGAMNCKGTELPTVMKNRLKSIPPSANAHLGSKSLTTDYHLLKKYIRVVDCQMSLWEPWSSCTAECGPGRMTRTRTVERQPQNGGRRCAALVQTRGCVGVHCGRTHGGAAVREVAMLLPAAFAWSRDANASTDIRRNLRLRYPKDPSTDPESEYCVPFEVIKATKACKKEKGFTTLKEGVRVCVRCERQAMRKVLGYRCPGHGVVEQVTRWSALSAAHCHGKWVRLNNDQPEQVEARRHIDEDEDDDDLDDDEDDEDDIKDSANENLINEDKTHKASQDKKRKKQERPRLSTCPACRDGALFIFV